MIRTVLNPSFPGARISNLKVLYTATILIAYFLEIGYTVILRPILGGSMTRDEVITIIYHHVSTHDFPKTCPNCGRVFKTLKEYIENTEQLGKPVSYDAEFNEWEPQKPMGTVAMSNCSCGSSLSLSSGGMPLPTLVRLMMWAKMESMKQKITVSELLQSIRDEINQKAIKEL